MAPSKRKDSSFKRSLAGFLQALFALALFTIFVIAWLVQNETITLPQWAKAFNGVSPELQKVYTAALVPAAGEQAQHCLNVATPHDWVKERRDDGRTGWMRGRRHEVVTSILAAIVGRTNAEVRSDGSKSNATVLSGSTVAIVLEC
ncbi:hypothetical protein F5Y13DRAFT_192567 [Hypoxylon sp. FL1857]|nr:hypothetical protein F5Y13DRAFT_192567 [Hypoxylon sp. FL1857]